MTSNLDRREFVKTALAGAAAAGTLPMAAISTRGDDDAEKKPLYKISLAQWSLHRALKANKLDNLDFPKVARKEFDIEAIEWVNQFFKDKAKDASYLAEMKHRCEEHDVKTLLIMVDGEGRLGDPDAKARQKAIENHHQWVEAAEQLGGHSIRVNAASEGSFDEQMLLAADGLRRLSEFAASYQLNVIVENHGGLSSNGKWLAGVMKLVDLPNCGTLPDFGNFRIEGDNWYDRYLGVKELMPFAKAVSAKSHEFDAEGNETGTDYRKMLQIVLDAGYRGYIGVEYEGSKHPEVEGVKLTKALLERVREELA